MKEELKLPLDEQIARAEQICQSLRSNQPRKQSERKPRDEPLRK